jgi:hypothetical protein
MAVAEHDLYDFLHEVFRAGARPGGTAIMLSKPQTLLEPEWGHEHFWDVVQQAEARGLIQPGRGLYVSPTLAGERMLRAGRPTAAPEPRPADPLSDLTELAARLSKLTEAEFSAVKQTVLAEQSRRAGAGESVGS